MARIDRRRYPVPWRFVGQKVWARADEQTVTLYTADDTRIADHARGRAVDPALVDACLPPQRAALRHRSRRFWLDRADAMGVDVGDHIRAVFDSDDVLEMLRPVQAMVTLLEVGADGGEEADGAEGLHRPTIPHPSRPVSASPASVEHRDRLTPIEQAAPAHIGPMSIARKRRAERE